MTVQYTPATAAGWVAISGTACIVVVDAASDPGALDRLTVSADAGVQQSLDVLARDGLAAAPSFAIVELVDATARVIVRGGVSVTVIGASGGEALDGSGVTSWSERLFPSVESLHLEVAGSSAADGVAPLRLGVGAAWVTSLEVLVSAAPSRPKQPEPVQSAPRASRTPVVSDPEATVSEVPLDLPSPASPSPLDDSSGADAGYDYLFGDTVVRPVADAAVVEPEEDAEVDEQPAGDHDGETVLVTDIAKLRAGRKSKRPVAAAAAEPPAPKVVLALAGGAREPLTQPILVGRAPSVTQVSGGQVPRLLTIGTADQDISRNHARIALEGGTVVVTDLHSKNGTLIVLPGKEPQKLRAGEPTAVIVGTVLDFGGGVTMTVEED